MSEGHSQFFQSPVEEVIRARHSVRNYKNERLSNDLKNKLEAYGKELKGPFEARARIEIVDELKLKESGGKRIGTYGVIRGASTYIVGITDNSEQALEELGYCLEKLVLYATSLGLGTCWLGGTFKRSDFSKIIKLKENEIIPIVIPVGNAEDKKTLLETIMRRSAGSDNRKSWNEIFYNYNFETALNQKTTGKYEGAFEMVRLAPSASNKQPWRLVMDDNYIHFYLEGTPGYGKALGFNIQKIDLGIAMSHFEMAAIEAGIQGHWEYEYYRQFSVSDENIHYIMSWMEE